MKNVSLIVAVSKNQVIGRNNKLAWNLPNDMKYFSDTSAGPFAVNLPTLRFVGDTIHLADSKYTWNINNLTVYAQGGDQIKDSTGFIDTFLNCDVAGEYVELIWEGTFWRMFS